MRLYSASTTAVVILATLALAPRRAEASCSRGTRNIIGTVKDSTGAAIAGATVASGTTTVHTAPDGAFVLPCAPADARISVEAPSFATKTVSIAASEHITLQPITTRQQVSVTAYAAPLAENASPSSVRILTGSQLRSSASVTLDGQLSQVPGFRLFRRSSSLVANPTAQGISLRGLGSTAASRTLVLANLIPVNDPFGGWIYWEEIPELAIDAVSIVRGGASDLYGSSAIGGVVEIEPLSTDHNRAEIVSSQGSFHTFDEAALLSGKRNGWSGQATGGVLLTDGYMIVAPEDRGPVDVNANLHAQNGRAVGEYNWSHAHAFLLGNVLNEARGNGTPLAKNGTRLWRYESGGDWTPVAAKGGMLRLRASGSTEHFRQSFSSVNAARSAETLTRFAQTPSSQLGASARWTQPLGLRLVLLGGADTRDIRGEDNEIATLSRVRTLLSARQRTTGMYAEALWTPHDWTLSSGARIDRFANFDAHQTMPKASSLPQVTETVANPRLGLVRRLNHTLALTATGFRAYRSPTLNELYRNGQVGEELTLHNPSLRSERATGWETGIVLTPAPWKTNLRASYFWTIVNRPITALTIAASPTAITKQRANLGQIRSQGLSLDSEWQPLPLLDIIGGYQYAAATVTRFDQNPALIGSWIPQVPHQMGTLQVRAHEPHLGSLTIEARASGQQFDDDANTYRLAGFVTLHAFASRSFGSRYEIFVAAENLLDRRVEVGRTPVLTLGQPQSVRGGLRIRIGS